MNFTLRPYQQEAVDQALLSFARDRPFIVQAATGAGKSLIIAELCHRLNAPVLILQPSKELLEQNYEKLKNYGIDDIGIYSASKNSREVARFTYATIGTVKSVPELFSHFKYVILDECHVLNPKQVDTMYRTFLQAIGNPPVCGLTATPYRIVSKFVKEDGELIYTATLKMLPRIGYPTFWSGGIVYKIETAELIKQGYLSPIRYDVHPTDWNSLQTNSTGADFTEDSIEMFWNDRRLQGLADTVRMIDWNCQRNLIFCSSIRQATRATEMLNRAGLPCALVTGTTPAKEREQIVKDFRSGKIRHLANVGVFTTGFDVPELDSIVLARPTMSLPLYYQMVGRGVRKDPKRPDKALIVTDLVGLSDRLGRVETIRLGKEDGGYKDLAYSEVGDLTEVALFRFKVVNKTFVKDEL